MDKVWSLKSKNRLFLAALVHAFFPRHNVTPQEIFEKIYIMYELYFEIMAEKLRWVDLVGTGIAGQQNHAIAQWTNESGRTVSIRDLTLSGQYKVGAGNTDCRVQVSMQNQYIGASGDRNWKVHLPLSQNTNWAAGENAVSFSGHMSKKYGVGQVEVDPGETVYLHDEQDAAVQDERVRCIFGYSLN
jgi:hypothetical protein